MKRILSAVAAAALGLGLLTACGGNDGGSKAGGSSASYCDDLKSAKKQVDALNGGDLSDIEKTATSMHKLGDEAPDDIKDDWTTLLNGIDKLVTALKKAGLDDADMAALQSGQIPDGVDVDALNTLQSEIQGLDTDDFKKAGEAITAQAKDKCGVDLDA